MDSNEIVGEELFWVLAKGPQVGIIMDLDTKDWVIRLQAQRTEQLKGLVGYLL